MNKNTGFTLIEVLIAMLVLAFGLLGLAGLQATSLKNNQSAYNRSQATQLAYDMADRIRSNLAEANKLSTSTYVTINPNAAAAQADCKTVSTTCTPADLAQNDLAQWYQDLITLPSVTTTPTTTRIDVDVATRIYTITIIWDDDHDGDNTNNPTFQTKFKL